jgi:hypothetical protein
MDKKYQTIHMHHKYFFLINSLHTFKTTLKNLHNCHNSTDKLRLHLTSINTKIFCISKEITLPISRNKNHGQDNYKKRQINITLIYQYLKVTNIYTKKFKNRM